MSAAVCCRPRIFSVDSFTMAQPGCYQAACMYQALSEHAVFCPPGPHVDR